MIRHLAAVALVMCLTPVSLYTQGTTLTVSTMSASVYKSPSTGSPVIGHANRGTVLQVTRELGSWVKVPWPGTPEGFAYLHVSTVTVSHSAAPEAYRAAADPAVRPAPAASPSTTVGRSDRVVPAQTPAPFRPVYVSPASHVVGLGARIDGPTLGYGATARAWRRNRIGMQMDVSRYALTSTSSAEQLTSLQIEPSVLYSFRNRVSDYVWLRPYVGSGANLSRQTLSGTVPGAESLTASRLGIQAFGGGELTFASVPQLSVSGDVGYHWAHSTFSGFDPGGVGVAVSAHWYVK
jgi:hypothetical protein